MGYEFKGKGTSLRAEGPDEGQGGGWDAVRVWISVMEGKDVW